MYCIICSIWYWCNCSNKQGFAIRSTCSVLWKNIKFSVTVCFVDMICATFIIQGATFLSVVPVKTLNTSKISTHIRSTSKGWMTVNFKSTMSIIAEWRIQTFYILVTFQSNLNLFRFSAGSNFDAGSYYRGALETAFFLTLQALQAMLSVFVICCYGVAKYFQCWAIPYFMPLCFWSVWVI